MREVSHQNFPVRSGSDATYMPTSNDGAYVVLLPRSLRFLCRARNSHGKNHLSCGMPGQDTFAYGAPIADFLSPVWRIYVSRFRPCPSFH